MKWDACFYGWGLLLMSAVALFGDERPLYVGTYTGGDSQGIYLLRFDDASGKLTNHGVAAKTENPSFLALHPNGKFLYAVNETSSGELSAFRIEDESGKLTFLNQVPSGGGAPCHLVVDRTGRTLLVANYSGGSVSSTQINPDGSLGKQISFVQHQGSSVNPRRQQAPHAHSINLDPKNEFAVVADLGTDELVVYRFVPDTGELAAHSVTRLTSGAGPRHFCFDRQGTRAYVINELDSTVAALRYDAALGKLTVRQVVSTLPDDFAASSHTAEVRVTADGRFVYGSNRGHDSIAVYRVRTGGDLKLVEITRLRGKTPRNFTLDPTGQFLLAAGQATNDIQVFRRDAESGHLAETPHHVAVATPVCLRFARVFP